MLERELNICLICGHAMICCVTGGLSSRAVGLMDED